MYKDMLCSNHILDTSSHWQVLRHYVEESINSNYESCSIVNISRWQCADMTHTNRIMIKLNYRRCAKWKKEKRKKKDA